MDADLEEVGIVEKIGDGIATVIGMKNAMAGELVELPHNVSGMVLNLNPDSVGIVLMGGEPKSKKATLFAVPAASWRFLLVKTCWAV